MSHDIALEEEFARAALKRATFRRLFAYLRPYRGRVILVLVLEAIWVVSMLVDPRLVRMVVDGTLPRGDAEGTLVIAAWMAANIL
ncbi:MAG: hypothetical protein ACYTG6_16945, partial [Planctomycetota bacterium]